MSDGERMTFQASEIAVRLANEERYLCNFNYITYICRLGATCNCPNLN